MSSGYSDLPAPSTLDKGKRRADIPTESTPLLQNNAYESTSRNILLYTTPPSSRRRLRSILSTVFLVSLSACLLFVIFFTLLAWSYASRASRLVPDRLLNEDVIVDGPFLVDMLNTTSDGGLWLNISGLMGFNAGGALGVNHPLPGENEGLLEHIWRAIGRWSIQQLDTVTVELDLAHVAPEYNKSATLLEAKLPPIEIPLTVDPPRRSKEWLTPVMTEVFIRPTSDVAVLADFMLESWKHGTLAVGAHVGELKVTGGGKENSWKASFHGRMKNVQTSFRLKIPSLPGLPRPGKDSPLPSVSDILYLTSFRVSSQHNLTLNAEASIINPIPEDLHFALPSLPFTVLLPNGTGSPVAVVNVVTHPFESTYPNITIHVSGTVPALPKSSSSLLSTFISRYLDAKPNPILISSPLLTPANSSDGSGIVIPVEFPAPHHRPNLLRNVTIKNMKIRPSGTTFLASGTVFAKIVLPRGIDVGVDVFSVFPDVLVFDGEVPSALQAGQGLWPHLPHTKTGIHHGQHGETKHAPPQMPSLPDPLPPRAFGHIRPTDWLPATSVRLKGTGGGQYVGDAGEETGAVYAVSAKVIDVPLQMLPGRQKEFSNFVGKVIFGSEGAVAGLEGYAAVTLEVDGLPLDVGDVARGDRSGHDKGATLELTGLPVRGSVRVGKKGL